MSIRTIATAVLLCALGGCSPPWPQEHFPSEMQIQETLYSDDKFGGLEGCASMVALLTQYSANRLMNDPGGAQGGWKRTPYAPSGSHLDPLTRIGRCGHESDSPPGDFQGILSRPGAHYRVINNGEGIAIVAPRARLAAFFYAG